MGVGKKRVVVGLPVYNGANYLATTLEAILDQTFTDFELVIGDNASTDETPDIVKRIAGDDPRVNYVRHETNLGAAPNYNAVYRLAGPSDYFCWIAHDDVPAPRYLEECVAALDSHPESVLAYTKTYRLDAVGDTHGTFPERPVLAGSDAPARFADVIHYFASTHPIFGVMRREALDRTGLHGSYAGSDRTLLAEMAFLGSFREVEDALFSIRDHPHRYTRSGSKDGSMRAQSSWFDSSNTGKITLPRWNRLYAYMRSIRNARISFKDRVRAYGYLTRWLFEKNGKALVWSLWVALGQYLSRFTHRLLGRSHTTA